ncbi:hypothetical protein Clacol_005560 [Clathrus columnatus]|uniref:GH15-like domain-containing protein n=1 Tax=Clathrus columnatus TaxID=1419009 RepID=A0AAV5ACX4_9AGAM|nr:hypothetical protein Clacol_005560 [Clathrus columnatus]
MYFSTRQSTLINSQLSKDLNYEVSARLLQRNTQDPKVSYHLDFLPLNESKEKPLLFWLVRKIEVIRGKVPIRMECAPAFNYARSSHTLSLLPDYSADPTINYVSGTLPQRAHFSSSEAKLNLDLRVVPDIMGDFATTPDVVLKSFDLRQQGHLGLSVCADMALEEGQAVWFILRVPPGDDEISRHSVPTVERAKTLGVSLEALVLGDSQLRAKDDPILTRLSNIAIAANSFHEQSTNEFWNNWIRKSTYQGLWREAVHRSALALKLLIFEPTGAVVASPTFSLPEMIGGTRNWDYRASWIRDSSFTLYALIRLGFTEEADGGKDLEEIELPHFDGHKGSKPVRIGNGAADHVQLDIYGELLDCIYLSQKFGKPLSYDIWVSVRELTDYVVEHYNDTDLSIWEVRDTKRNFTVMMWVAIDRAIRLADKRSFPCPNRFEWYKARDQIYEDVIKYAWNKEEKFFAQSYEETDILDSAVLIMPLVFFSSATDNRYDVNKASDGVGGEEGTFCLCTLWAVEALTRAGKYDATLLNKARRMFEVWHDFLQYTNHLGLCTEEIGLAGEGLGNAVQGFTHVTLISAAFNLSRTLERRDINI